MKDGFTIIELIISVFILSIAIVGIFSAFSVMVILTANAADQLTATYLAQEGMEVVRNIRDTNWLTSGAVWDEGLTGCDKSSMGCEADYTTGTGTSGTYPIVPWSGRYLYVSSDGFYDYATDGTKTKFKRKIIIATVIDVDGLADSDKIHILKVTAQVSWDQKATILNNGFSAGDCQPSNCVTTEETLYNWYNFTDE